MTESKSMEGRRKRVVIIDDSRTMQAVQEQLLSTRLGYDVVGIAGDARSGLAMIRRLLPDLVTIGFQMPYIDGRELLEEMRGLPYIRKLVISDSVAGNPALQARMESLGVDACIGKSALSRDIEGFCRSVRSLMSNDRRAARIKPGEGARASHATKATVRPQPAVLGYPVPRDERERLSALDTLHLANDDADHQLDLLTKHLGKTTGFSACVITFIDQDMQWTKSAYGIGRGSCPREQSVCSHTICGDEPFIVEDLLADRRFSRLESVRSGPKIRSYVGYPIVGSTGVKLGTVCLLDTAPRRVSISELTNLRSIARMAAELIESRVAPLKRAA